MSAAIRKNPSFHGNLRLSSCSSFHCRESQLDFTANPFSYSIWIQMLEGGTSKPWERSSTLLSRPVCLLQLGERAPCAKIENSGITDDRPRQQKQTQVLEAYS